VAEDSPEVEAVAGVEVVEEQGRKLVGYLVS